MGTQKPDLYWSATADKYETSSENSYQLDVQSTRIKREGETNDNNETNEQQAIISVVYYFIDD